MLSLVPLLGRILRMASMILNNNEGSCSDKKGVVAICLFLNLKAS